MVGLHDLCHVRDLTDSNFLVTYVYKFYVVATPLATSEVTHREESRM